MQARQRFYYNGRLKPSKHNNSCDIDRLRKQLDRIQAEWSKCIATV